MENMIVVQSYRIVVNIPMTRKLEGIEEMCIVGAEDAFIQARDTATSEVEKRNFDRARALLKYAKECGAMLKSVEMHRERMLFDLAFDSTDALVAFNKKFREAVELDTMS